MIEHRWEPLDAVFVGLSRLGYGGALWLILALVATVLARRPSILVWVAAAVLTADGIALALKALVGRPRPFELDDDPEPLLLAIVGASFPSGHAATSFAGATMLARYLRGRALLLFLLAAAVAFSRVYVGVHYPADVLAGAAIGAAVAIALPRLAAVRRRSPREPRPG